MFFSSFLSPIRLSRGNIFGAYDNLVVCCTYVYIESEYFIIYLIMIHSRRSRLLEISG
jgi:hypothetical protein